MQTTMEHHIFNGNIHYFDWAIFNTCASLPEGILIYIVA